METTRLYDPNLHGDSVKVEDYHFNHIALCDALQQARNNDPRFKSVALDDMAEMIGLSRSNFQRLRKGGNPDPRSSTIWLICSTLHIDAHKLLGLPAPVAETQPENGSTIAAMERHMHDLERRDEKNTQELEHLRGLVSEKGEALSRANEHVRHLEATIDEQRKAISRGSRQRTILIGLLFVAVALLAYCAYEIANPHIGLSSWFM